MPSNLTLFDINLFHASAPYSFTLHRRKSAVDGNEGISQLHYFIFLRCIEMRWDCPVAASVAKPSWAFVLHLHQQVLYQSLIRTFFRLRAQVIIVPDLKDESVLFIYVQFLVKICSIAFAQLPKVVHLNIFPACRFFELTIKINSFHKCSSWFQLYLDL